MALKFARILLKLSGEALQGPEEFGLHAPTLADVAQQIKQVYDLGVEIGLVVGGGNIFRGAQINNAQIDRMTKDQMGMMATVINGLALRDVLAAHGMPTMLMSAVPMLEAARPVDAMAAREALAAGKVVIFAGGTGNPFVTTDTAATLRGVEIAADAVLKATKVDGIYDDDPVKNAQAIKFDRLTYDEVIARNLKVMDLAAFAMCREQQMPIVVFDMFKQDALLRIVQGEQEGTLVTGEVQ
jgi:uridylate kinase